VPRHMFYSRLFAGISFLGFAFGLGGTLRLAVAECAWRWGPTPSAVWSMAIGNTRRFEDLAEWHPALTRGALRAAVRLNPHDSAAWIALGLAAEGDGDMEQAASCLLEAEKVDRQYLPAWTSANFFFRRANDAQFWRAATRAAAMSYDDPAPLIELADHREPNAIAALEHLGDTARVERGYLHFLIGQSRWREAEDVAARLSLRGEKADQELLLNFTDRLIEANASEAALAVWNRLDRPATSGPTRHSILANQNFQSQPSGKGFDWRVTEPPRGSVHWEPSKLEFWLAASSPDACPLLEQWVVLDPGHYRLRFKYRTEGLANETGLRWTLLHRDRVETSSAALAQSSRRVANGNVADWNFRVAEAGLYKLAWIYIRVPGTTHQEGHAALAFASLEVL
jgi:tetratricopeptide (TPR) repeat protein